MTTTGTPRLRLFAAAFTISGLLVAVTVSAWSPSPPHLQSDPTTSMHPLLINSALLRPATIIPATATAPRDPTDRLPRHVVPKRYVVTHRPILDLGGGGELNTAPGFVTITVEAVQGGHNNVTLNLNAPLVSIDEPRVRVTREADGSDLGPLTHTYQVEKDFYTISLTTPGLKFKKGVKYNLEIPYTTRAASEPFGLWIAPSPDPEEPPGTPEAPRISVTILEPNFARRLLPCFDEPELKAVIEVVIGRGPNHQTLSHTPIMKTTVQEHIYWDHYEPTPLMSIYLLCMVVAPSHYTATYDDQGGFGGGPVASWAPRHLMEGGAGLRSARTTAKSLTYFQERYQTPYALRKLDSIVIPGFPAGALENWGLNTYVEGRLLHFDGKTTERDRGRSILIQHHEVSHAWFGNLVTCRWWDDIWVNEGLANYQSFKGVAVTAPEYDPVTLFVSDAVQVGMRADQDPTLTHPVHFSTLPENWIHIFDALSYAKGASLIRMLEGILGADLLDAGLRQFLADWAFKAADQNDLFRSIGRAVSEAGAEGLLPPTASINSIMKGWTLQSGYPLVNVRRVTGRGIYISQKQFTLERGSQVAPASPSLWDIPIKIARASDPNPAPPSPPDLWLTPTQPFSIYVDHINTNKWLLVNPDAFGFYRVVYDTHLFRLLVQQLETDPHALSPGSRSQLFDDYWNLEAGGYVTLSTALELTRYLRGEDHLVVWTPVFYHIRPYFTRLSGTCGFGAFQRYWLPRVESALNTLGWAQRPLPDLGNEVVLRANLLDWACGLGSYKCGVEAERLYREWEATPGEIYMIIPVDLQATILCAAVGGDSTGADAHRLILEQYKGPLAIGDSPLRARLVAALGCASESELISATLTAALDFAQIDPSHRLTLFQRVAENPAGRTLAWGAGKEAVLGGGLTVVQFEQLVFSLAGFWFQDSNAAALKSFIDSNEQLLAPVRPGLDSQLSRIKANGVWMEEKGRVVVEWMEDEN